jgi:hypothetical protein
MYFVWIALSILFVWLIFLSIIFWSLFQHYNKLLKGSTQKTLQGLLDNVLSSLDINKQEIELLKKRCLVLEEESALHIQKIGLLRFNPFHDTGGDQSFILALLDSKETGVVISGLYSRSGTRWYAKKIVAGKSVDHDLSDEEKKAVKEAKVIGK